MRRTMIVALFAFVIASNTASAEIIDGYSPARHDLFATGTYPNTSIAMPPVPNSSFYLNVYDFSGVGWVPTAAAGTQNVAMISPRHYVGATHFPLGIGTTVAFRAKDGSYLTRTVASQTTIAGDVMVGELDADLPTGANGVAVYPIPVGANAQFVGQTTFLMGQQGRIGRNLIWDVNMMVNVGTGPTQAARNDFDVNVNLDGRGFAPPLPPPATPPTDEFVVQGGDSGSPTFLPVGGQLSLLGAHQGLFAPGGVQQWMSDTFLTAYQSQLNTHLMLDGFSLNTIPVPEPSSLALAGLAGLAGFGYSRRRRRVA